VSTEEKPTAADEQRTNAAGTHERSIEIPSASGPMARTYTDNPGKSRHGENRSHREGNQVRCRVHPRWQSEYGKDSKKVRTPGKTMQQSNPHRGMGVSMRTAGMMVLHISAVGMDMHMSFSIVFMFMSMDGCARCFTNGPQPNPDQKHSHQPFAPARQ
jgi:hypothetical protein